MYEQIAQWMEVGFSWTELANRKFALKDAQGLNEAWNRINKKRQRESERQQKKMRRR